MNILCICFLDNPNTSREVLVREIYGKSGSSKPDLIILPGNFVDDKNKFRSNDGEWVEKFVRDTGVPVFFENISTERGATRRSFHFCDRDSLQDIGSQIFFTSAEVRDDISLCRSLIKIMESGQRSVIHQGVEFGILICGENNVLVNEQKKANTVRWRCGKPKGWKPNVVLNPAHSTMGNWGKLKNRFEKLSLFYGYVIYLTNSTCANFGRSSLKIYKGGKEIVGRNAPPIISSNNLAAAYLLRLIS